MKLLSKTQLTMHLKGIVPESRILSLVNDPDSDFPTAIEFYYHPRWIESEIEERLKAKLASRKRNSKLTSAA